MKTLKLGSRISKHQRLLNEKATRFEKLSNKKKFIKFFYKNYKTSKNIKAKTTKAELFFLTKNKTKIFEFLKQNSESAKEKKIFNYKSFLIHCKKVIEKAFYG